MRNAASLLFILTGSLLLSASSSSAVIVNIDVDGWRTAGGGNNGVPAVVYSGIGAAGGGNIFNGVNPAAVSDNSASTTTGDNQTISGSGLLDSTGAGTTVGFSIGPVGPDNESPVGDPATNQSKLFSDYVFTHGAAGNTNGNDPGNSSFLISGLTAGAIYDVYLYAGFANVNNLNTTVITGGSIVTPTLTGIYSSNNTKVYEVAADGSGNIAGTMGAGTQILGGLTVASVPEPTTLGLLGIGGLCFLARRRSA